MVNANDGWAVGWGSSIFRWDGQTWNIVPKPGIGTSYYSVFMVDSNDGWAVGTFGHMVWWNGTDWTIVPTPISDTLYSVFMVDSNDGWAVGEDGAILRWNGSSWKNVTSPTTARLESVFMVSSNDGWAVGEGGTILRWNGANWNIEPKINTAELNSVFMLNSNEGYAVGYNTILRWNGSNWNIVPNPTTDSFLLSSVFMLDSNDGWAVGYGGRIFRLDESGWYEIFTNPTTVELNSVFSVSADDAWAVGSIGTILRLIDEKALKATFTVSSDKLAATELVNFDASDSSDSVGTIIRYDWNFGDDSNDSGITTTHSYEYNGTYTVTLTVTNDEGSKDIASKNIVVGYSTQDLTAPWGNLKINNDEEKTNSLSVTLNLEATDLESGVTEMRFRNEDSTWTDWEDYSTTKQWTLTSGDGTKKLFVQFKNGATLVSEYSAAIILEMTNVPTQEPFNIDLGQILAVLTIGSIISGGLVGVWKLIRKRQENKETRIEKEKIEEKEKKRHKIVYEAIKTKVNNAYNKFREDPGICEEELKKLHDEALKKLENDKIDDSQYNSIKKIIDEYLTEYS